MTRDWFGRTPEGDFDTVVMPVEALRGWHVPHGEAILRSYNFPQVVWTPGKRVEAKCLDEGSCWGAEGCCAGKCDGGIYAVKNLKTLVRNVHPAVAVIGKVWLWGRIVEHEYGYRAQYAYPAAIFDTKECCREIAGLYGVPLLPDPFAEPA